jgi:hypothetical protein
MKRFIAISLLLLIGMITTVAASPPGLNSIPNVTVQVVADQADLQAAFVETNYFVMIPDAQAMAGCFIGTINYTVDVGSIVQAELQPVFLFKHTELTQVAESNSTIIPVNDVSTKNKLPLIGPVCAIARNAVMPVFHYFVTSSPPLLL